MTVEATAAIAHTRDGRMTLEKVVLDDLRAHEVLIRLEACGICHTDEKFRQRLPLPAVFGHEGVGIVEAIGNEVTDVAPSDRVLMSYPFCTTCPSCLRDEPFCCEEIPALKFGGARTDGTRPVSLDGAGITSAFFQQSSFATHAIALEQALIPVDAGLAPGILAALPCGVQTGAGAIMNTFGATPGDSLLVVGAGAVGLSAVMAANVVGMSPVVCVEVHPGRRALAAELGASQVIDPEQDSLFDVLQKEVPGGVRFALDTSASVAGLEQVIRSIGKGGTAGIVSYPNDGDPFPFNTKELFSRVGKLVAITQGSSIPRQFLPLLIDLYLDGRFAVDRLVTTYPFSDINQALADAREGTAVKPVLLMP